MATLVADPTNGTGHHVGPCCTVAEGVIGSHNMNHENKAVVVSEVSKMDDPAHSYTEVSDEVGYEGDTDSKSSMTENSDKCVAGFTHEVAKDRNELAVTVASFDYFIFRESCMYMLELTLPSTRHLGTEFDEA